MLHIVEDLKIGGLERVIADIVTRLDQDKFHAKVWCLFRGGDIFEQLKQSGIDAEILGMRSDKDIGFLIRLAGRLRRENIHIIHAHGYTATSLARVAAIMARTPVIIAHMHSTYWAFSRKQLFVEKILSFFTDRIICCSHSVADFVTEVEQIDPRKVAVIYNGVDFEKYALKDPNAWPKRAGGYIIGCVARLAPCKGHKYLLEAARQVIKRFPGEVRFVIIGDGALRSELEEFTAGLGIKDHVSFKGPVLDIIKELASIDIAVLASSEREGLSLSLIEALAAGIPSVGTSIGGTREVIISGQNGILVPPKDPDSFAKAILSLLADPQTAMTMGRRGRKVIEEKFSVREMLEKVTALYNDLAGKKIKGMKP